MTDRFQTFESDWPKNKKTDLVDVSQIRSVPMSFFVATKDEVCPHATAMEYIPQIQSEITQIDVEGVGHLWFSGEANTDWFMQNLID